MEELRVNGKEVVATSIESEEEVTIRCKWLHPHWKEKKERPGAVEGEGQHEGESTSVKNKFGKGIGVYQFHQTPMEDDAEFFPASKFLAVVEMYESTRTVLVPVGKGSPKGSAYVSPNVKERERERRFHLGLEDDDFLRSRHQNQRTCSATQEA